MKLTIDRKRWLRGEGSKPSMLLRPDDGKMCCLGFLSLACGYTKEEISGKSSPMSMIREYSDGIYYSTFVASCGIIRQDAHVDVKYPDAIVSINGNVFEVSSITKMLMSTNDDKSISESHREFMIKEIFNDIGIHVEFVDEAND